MKKAINLKIINIVLVYGEISWCRKLESIRHLDSQFNSILFCFFRVRLKGVEERHARYHGGAWQKVVFVVLSDKALPRAENVFECEVTLPHTEYATKRTTIYTPSNYFRFSILSTGFQDSRSANADRES
jgi:hypothetical protein